MKIEQSCSPQILTDLLNKSDDFLKDINRDVKDKFETGNYPKDHPSGILAGCNKKVAGIMKDETGGKISEDFFWLRAEIYSSKMLEGKEEKKCKGVKKHVIKKNISHEDNETMQMRKLYVVRSYKHEIVTETINKIALSTNNDKRIIVKYEISSYS